MDTNPYNFTGAAAEQAVLQAIFGNNPLGGMIAQYGTPLLNRMLGLEGPGYRSAFLDTTLLSNMTPYGIYRDSMRTTASRMAASALTHQRNAAQRQWIENVNRTFMSFDSWRATEEGQKYAAEDAQAAYDAFIANKAQGQMSNPLWSLGYNALDPLGLNAASTYLQQAGANQIRFGALKGSRTAMLQARAIGELFLEDGEYKFDPTKYGYMNVGEASAIAAALTKDRDFFSEPGVRNMEQAVGNLKKAVQKYTEALAPLKDIFGSDIPGMIKAIEDLAGQRFSRIDPTRMQNMVTNVMANAVVGGYNLGDVVNLGSQMRASIGQMNVPFMNELGAMSQAMTVLNMTATGLAPAYMSDARYRQRTGDWVMRTSNSSGAGYLNAAAAIWMDRNPDGTTEQFLDAYNKLRRNYTETEAMMRLTGTRSLYQLEDRGRQSANYARMIEEDVGGVAARRESLRSLIRAGWARSSNRGAYEKAIKLLEDNPQLMSDPSAIESMNIDGAVKGQFYSILSGAGLKGRYGEALVAGLAADAEYRITAPQIARQKRLMASTNALRLVLPGSIGGAVNSIMSGDLSMDKWLQNKFKIELADPEAIKMLESVRSAALEFGGQDKDFMAKQLTYAFMNGASNGMYLDALQNYEKAKGPNEKYIWARRMAIVSGVDEKRLQEAVGKNGEGWTDIERDYIAASDRYVGKDNAETLVMQDLEDMMTYRNLEGLLKGSNIDPRFLKEVKSLARKEGYMQIGDVKAIVTRMQKEGTIDTQKADQLNQFINQSFGRESSTDTIMQDFMGSANSLIQSITSLVETIAPMVEKLKEDPSNK